MVSPFYLPRKLVLNDRICSEAELLEVSNYIVVLAEPGGGKTELLSSLADQLGTAAVTANVFGQLGAELDEYPLVIDAFDELVKVYPSGISKLLAFARKANPTQLIISSRSSEWSNATSSLFYQFFGNEPLIVRLCEFNELEQGQIFQNYAPDEDFKVFKAEVSRFYLDPLLPNPQFLKLFTDAYIESGRHFTDKKSIFSQAVERLAKEVNTSVFRTSQALSSIQKVELSSEVFAKLLLSGAEGVSTSEATEDRLYPFIASLLGTNLSVDSILATRLFKSNYNTDLHLPVHKIIAEYCAAHYLTERIAAPEDPLTLSECLPIIAPNSIVRDELRGLLGWMASLGNKTIEEELIRLDPYAVLANGDPSQLEQSSKRMLISRLQDIEANDPYFRRGDFWRRFSAAGFFSSEVIEEIRPLLTAASNGHLRDLILELLAGSPAVGYLEGELRCLLLAKSESENTRFLAAKCLQGMADYKYQADLDSLISEASHTSLRVASDVISSIDPKLLERSCLADYFLASSTLYPGHKDRRERTIGRRYFVKRLINKLNLVTVEWLLDELTNSMKCTCGKKHFECYCRNGISKVVGTLLDRYFDLASPPYNESRVWQWIRNLNFHERKSAQESRSIHVLQDDDSLRQGIIALAFEKLIDSNQIFDLKLEKFDLGAHAGLQFQARDYQFVVDLAFQVGNPVLWASFMARHQFYRNVNERGPDDLRRHMREQASENPLFMREWAKLNRRARKQFKQSHSKSHQRYSRLIKRRAKKKGEMRVANIKYVHENRKLVEGGQHWGLLIHFADLVLFSPDKIEEEYGDQVLIRNALLNCIDFIAPDVPSLKNTAELKCVSKRHPSIRILYASCLEIMRTRGRLDSVNLRLLQSLRADISGGYPAVSEKENAALKVEVDRVIFEVNGSPEVFLRQYIEPQLMEPTCHHPDVWLLRSDKAFEDLRSELSVEWLRRFPRMAFSSLDTLFEVAAQFADREKLEKLILERCAEFVCGCPSSTGNEYIEQRRSFWFLRAWYFLRDPPRACSVWLKADKNNLLALHSRSGSLNIGDSPYWPDLTSDKLEAVLDSFIGKWMKVELPDDYGTDSPVGETAYRFLKEVIWLFSSASPDEALPAIDRLLADDRYIDFYHDLKSIRSTLIRQKALRDFEPPTSVDIVKRLDDGAVVTVEGLRQLVIQELQDFQKAINGGEFNSAHRFYEKGDRLGEVRSTEIIAERLSIRLEPQGITITPEHQLKNGNRSDFTVSKIIGHSRRMLVTEVKGQWHDELYTAASEQLRERYSIHPDAEQQGVYLVIWFGCDEKVAGRKKHGISCASELKEKIEAHLSSELLGLIDVFVLDVSR